MSNNFRVGQKVVCVDDKNDIPGSCGFLPGEEIRQGHVYTITSTHLWHGIPVVWLAEVSRAWQSVAIWGANCGYGAHRFRPAVERGEETGMAILRKILTDNRVNA